MKKEKKWKPLRINRMLNKREYCNIDYAIAVLILPLLEGFRKANKGYPSYVGSLEKWNKIIDKMIFSFREIAEEYKNKPNTFSEEEAYKKYSKKINRGLKLFGKHYNNLWI